LSIKASNSSANASPASFDRAAICCRNATHFLLSQRDAFAVPSETSWTRCKISGTGLRPSRPLPVAGDRSNGFVAESLRQRKLELFFAPPKQVRFQTLAPVDV
jgi:hypothetical protein